MKEKIIKLQNNAIAREAWDHCVSVGEPFLPAAFSWMLDEVSPGWEGIVLLEEDGAYQAVLPVPLVSRFGFRFVRQSPFSFLLGVTAKKGVRARERKGMVELMEASYRFISQYKMYGKPEQEESLNKLVQEGCNYVLDLQQPYAEIAGRYSKNRFRDIQKAVKNGLQLKAKDSLDEFFLLFRQFTQQKVYNLTDAVTEKARSVFHLLQKRQLLRVQNVYSGKECVGSAVFFVHERGLYYLMASYADGPKANGSSTLLIDGIIREYAGKIPFLSFNGSNEAGLARFYASFGATPVSFSILRQQRLPSPLRKLIDLRSRLFKMRYQERQTLP